MSRGISLGMPLSDFLLEANRLAGVVIRHADRLSAASGGRIGADTAEEMQNLTAEILRIERERERKLVGPIRPLIRRAEKLVTEIGTAARFIALDKPVVAQQLQRLRSGPRKRSAADARWALEMHLGLVREHRPAFATILSTDFTDEAARTLTAMDSHRDARRAMTEESAAQLRRRNDRVVRLQRIVSEIRVLAQAADRNGDIAKEFEWSSQRSCRARQTVVTTPSSRTTD